MVPLKVRQFLPVVKAAGREEMGNSCPAPRQPLPRQPGAGLFVPGGGPTIPVVRPTDQARVKGVPVRRPGVRVEAPNVWVAAPAIPMTCPGVPVADLCVPVTRPTGFSLKSGALLDNSVQFWGTGGGCPPDAAERENASSPHPSPPF